MKQKQQSNEQPFVFEVVVLRDNQSYSVELNRPKTGKYKVDYYATSDDPNCIFMEKRFHGDFECFFQKAGTYRIALHGSFPGLLFRDMVYRDYPKIGRELMQACKTYEEILSEDEGYYVYYLSKIISWGTNVWQKMDYMFCCEFLNIQAVDAPDLSHVNILDGMFSGCDTFNSPIEHWNVSNITSMWQMFGFCAHFNQPLNRWNVSNVTEMGQMFLFACSFNQPLNGWNVSRVKDMVEMFKFAKAFNQSLDSWNVSSIDTEADLGTPNMDEEIVVINGKIVRRPLILLPSWQVLQRS